MEKKMSLKNGKSTFPGLIKTWMKVLKNRNELRSLNERDLKDIGLTKVSVVQGTNDLFRI